MHGYDNLDYQVIEDVLTVKLEELKRFGDLVENAMQGHATWLRTSETTFNKLT